MRRGALRLASCCWPWPAAAPRRSGSGRIPTRGSRASCWPPRRPTGPVRLEVNGIVRASDTTVLQPRMAEQAARGVRKHERARSRMAPVAPARRRLMLVVRSAARMSTSRRSCTASPLPAAVPCPEPLRLRAIFCDGGTFIADSTGVDLRHHRRRHRPPDLAHGRRPVPGRLSRRPTASAPSSAYSFARDAHPLREPWSKRRPAMLGSVAAARVDDHALQRWPMR